MGGRSLSAEENQRVITALRSILQKDTQVALAKRLKVTPSTLSSLLGGRHAAGVHFARKVAVEVGVPLDELLTGRRSAALVAPWRDLPGYEQAKEEAERLYGATIPPEAWEWVGSLAGAPPPAMHPATLGQIALVWVNRPQVAVSGVQRKRGG